MSPQPTPSAATSTAPMPSLPSSPAPTAGACVELTPTRHNEMEYFNGSCYGWRLATSDVLEAEGLGRNLQLDCEAKRYGRDHRTDLDFKLGYVPKGAHVDGVEKWACGRTGLSVYTMVSSDTPIAWVVDIERSLTGSKAINEVALPGRVEPCEVRGHPAICVHYLDDAQPDRGGRVAEVIVIEDGTLDPHAVVLRVDGDGIAFDELMKIAEGIED